MPGYSLPLGPKHMIAMGHPRRTPGVTIHNPRQAAQRVGCCLTTNRSYLLSPRTPHLWSGHGADQFVDQLFGPRYAGYRTKTPGLRPQKKTLGTFIKSDGVEEAVGFKRPRQRRCAGCWESSARICQYNVNTHYFLPERKNNSR